MKKTSSAPINLDIVYAGRMPKARAGKSRMEELARRFKAGSTYKLLGKGKPKMRERPRRFAMYLAVAVENHKHPSKKQNYKIWYLEIGPDGKVRGVGVKTKEDLLKSVFENYRQTGKTHWRCFQKEREESTPIEIYDFIAMNSNDNTHFGNLPTLSEFQTTLDSLRANLELRSIA